jgi:hypothetical protein
MYWLGGIETLLVMAAAAWLTVGYLENWPRWTVWLIGSLPWLRPDLAPLAVLAAVACVRHRGQRAFVAIGVTAAAWLTLAMISHAGLIPVTIEAKRTFLSPERPSLEQWIRGVVFSFAVLVPLNGALLVGGVISWFMVPRGWTSVVAASTVVLPTLATAPQVLPTNNGRYLAALVPWLLMGFVVLARQRPPLAKAALLAVTVWTVAGVPAVAGWWRDAVRFSQSAADMAAFIRRLQPAAPILLHDAGHPSEHTNLQYVDLVGLKTPTSLAIYRETGRQRPEAFGRIACGGHVTGLVTLEYWDRELGFTRALREHGWSVERLYSAGTHYMYYSLRAPTTCHPGVQ